MSQKLKNTQIIAQLDNGKTTLADRLLQLNSGPAPEIILDDMDAELQQAPRTIRWLPAPAPANTDRSSVTSTNVYPRKCPG